MRRLPEQRDTRRVSFKGYKIFVIATGWFFLDQYHMELLGRQRAFTVDVIYTIEGA